MSSTLIPQDREEVRSRQSTAQQKLLENASRRSQRAQSAAEVNFARKMKTIEQKSGTSSIRVRNNLEVKSKFDHLDEARSRKSNSVAPKPILDTQGNKKQTE